MTDSRTKTNPDTRRSGGGRVVLALVLTGAVIGVFAYRSLVASETVLARDLAAMKDRGASLSVDGCIDAVIDWRMHCDAMKSLCDQTVPRFMAVCLAGADRGAYCEALGVRSGDTRFGFEECKARGGDRDEKKACAVIHRMIDGHCKAMEKRS